MARAVAGFTDLLPQIRVPAIMAGQVLEHMTREPAPTRSEVCYLHDALARGYEGFVLSDEAAIGQYPVESCQAAAMFRDSI
jgi:pyruvate kinase